MCFGYAIIRAPKMKIGFDMSEKGSLDSDRTYSELYTHTQIDMLMRFIIKGTRKPKECSEYSLVYI